MPCLICQLLKAPSDDSDMDSLLVSPGEDYVRDIESSAGDSDHRLSATEKAKKIGKNCSEMLFSSGKHNFLSKRCREMKHADNKKNPQECDKSVLNKGKQKSGLEN